MKKLILLFLLAILYSKDVFAEALDLSGYQEPSGAITTLYRGNTVDPYFATKALLIAKESGMDTAVPAKAWIKWAISKQDDNGLFHRYARDVHGLWKLYAAADADDAALAQWLQILYSQSPNSGMPKKWSVSASKAQAQLAELFDTELGIYYISKSLSVGLLMDNIEIYSAFKSVAHEQKRLGMLNEALLSEYQASRLKDSIIKVFMEPSTGIFRITTQVRYENVFYPDLVAQIYPLLYQLQDKSDAEHSFHNWIDVNGKEWFKQINSDYPWGLVAITALNMNDANSASCWQNRAEPMRYSMHWNVLEEAALQQVKWRLSMRQDNTIPCTHGDLI
ncbi:MAG: hypothetical protein K2Q14_03480 [Gammaproteobacteria bacterium]|nr:hypothetical protein [Gammaproteobacteria bacterium]